MKYDFKKLRGGSWFRDGRSCRSAFRGADPPGYRSSNFGFRLVASFSAMVLRGGSKLNLGEDVRSTGRLAIPPGDYRSGCGFRLVSKE